MEITHTKDPETGARKQIVSPARLRAILDKDGDDYSRPRWFADDDEWDCDSDLE